MSGLFLLLEGVEFVVEASDREHFLFWEPCSSQWHLHSRRAWSPSWRQLFIHLWAFYCSWCSPRETRWASGGWWNVPSGSVPRIPSWVECSFCPWISRASFCFRQPSNLPVWNLTDRNVAFLFDPFVYVVVLDRIYQGIGVWKEQVVFSFEVIVNGVVAEIRQMKLTQVKNWCPNAYSLVIHDFLLIDFGHAKPVAKARVLDVQFTEPLDIFLAFGRQFQFHSVLDTLHGLSKDWVVHQFEEVLLFVLQNSFFAFVRLSVLKSMYCFNQSDWKKKITLCIW